MILPGCSAVSMSTLVPCSSASTRRVSAATRTPSGSRNRAVQIESRPNRVKNHGAPAAMNSGARSPGVDAAAVVIRNPSRSPSARSSQRSSRSSAVGSGRFHGTGVDTPCTAASSSPKRADQLTLLVPRAGTSTVHASTASPGGPLLHEPLSSAAPSSTVPPTASSSVVTPPTGTLPPCLIASIELESRSIAMRRSSDSGRSSRDVIVTVSVNESTPTARCRSRRTPGSAPGSSTSRSIDARCTAEAPSGLVAMCSGVAPSTVSAWLAMTRTSPR